MFGYSYTIRAAFVDQFYSLQFSVYICECWNNLHLLYSLHVCVCLFKMESLLFNLQLMFNSHCWWYV